MSSSSLSQRKVYVYKPLYLPFSSSRSIQSCFHRFYLHSSQRKTHIWRTGIFLGRRPQRLEDRDVLYYIISVQITVNITISLSFIGILHFSYQKKTSLINFKEQMDFILWPYLEQNQNPENSALNQQKRHKLCQINHLK